MTATMTMPTYYVLSFMPIFSRFRGLTMADVVQEIISLLTSGLTSIASGIGSGMKALVEAIFLETSEGAVTGLSTFGGLIVVFAGVSLAIGLSRWVVSWVTSLGSNN